jgi:hypothetical protein
MKKQIIYFSTFAHLNRFIDQVLVFDFEVNRKNFNIIGHFSESDLKLAQNHYNALVTELSEPGESFIYLN